MKQGKNDLKENFAQKMADLEKQLAEEKARFADLEKRMTTEKAQELANLKKEKQKFPDEKSPKTGCLAELGCTLCFLLIISVLLNVLRGEKTVAEFLGVILISVAAGAAAGFLGMVMHDLLRQLVGFIYA